MSTITLSNTLTNGQTADADEVMENLNDILNVVNGSIDEDNISSSSALSVASITMTGTLTTNTIAEKISAEGVTIDGVLIKDDLETSGIAAYIESKILTTVSSSSTPRPARASKKTEYEITALSATANFRQPTGTPANGDLLFISVTDNGHTRALTYNAIYDDPYSATLPTTTVKNKTILMLFRYSSARTKWELLFTDEEA
jgi:hypothetical protein